MVPINFTKRLVKNKKLKNSFPKGATYNLKKWKGKCTICGFKDGGAY